MSSGLPYTQMPRSFQAVALLFGALVIALAILPATFAHAKKKCSLTNDCGDYASSVQRVNGKCVCTCSEGAEGKSCSSLRSCSSELDCNGEAANVVTGTYADCDCGACTAAWGGSSCDCEMSAHCDVSGTDSITGSNDTWCMCNCKVGYSGTRCSQTTTATASPKPPSASITSDISSSTSISVSSTKERTLSASGGTVSWASSISSASSLSHSNSADGLSASKSASQDAKSASNSISMETATAERTHSVSLSCSLSKEITFSASQTVSEVQASSTVTLFLSPVTQSLSSSASSPLGSSSTTESPSAWRSSSVTHHVTLSKLTVTSSISLSRSRANSASRSVWVTVTRPPTMTHDLTLTESLAESYSTSRTSSGSGGTRTRSVSTTLVSARITESLTCVMAPRVVVIPNAGAVLEAQQEQRRHRRALREAAAQEQEEQQQDSSSEEYFAPIVADPLQSLLFSRCGFKAKAEAVLANGTALPCMELNAASTYSLSVFPANRGPPPPFLIALPYSVDANWILRFRTNITSESAMLRPDDLMVDIMSATATSSTAQMQSETTSATANTTTLFTSSVLLDNATNLTSRTGTLFLRVDATPEWMSHTSVEVEAICGFYPSRVQFVVRWPQKQLSTAQQVLVGLISGGGALSGDPTAAAALAMIGLLSCSGSTPALQSAGYFVSLFFNLGPAAVGAGNLGLIGAVFVLQYAGVRVWMRFKAITDEIEAMAELRFPALAVFVAAYLLPGAVYGGVVSVASDQDAAVGGLVLLVVAVLLVASQVFLFRRILPTCEFVPYAVIYPSAFAFERLALLPTSHWAPESVERRYMPLLGTRTKQWCLLSIADVLLALVLSAATGLGVGTGGASCSVMPVVVAACYLANAALIVVLRPHRRPMDRVVFPIIWTLFGVLCLFKYVNIAEEVTDPLQLALSTLQLWQNGCSVWVLLRERQCRAWIAEKTTCTRTLQEEHEKDDEDEHVFWDDHCIIPTAEASVTAPTVAVVETIAFPPTPWRHTGDGTAGVVTGGAWAPCDDNLFWDADGNAVVAGSSLEDANGDGNDDDSTQRMNQRKYHLTDDAASLTTTTGNRRLTSADRGGGSTSILLLVHSSKNRD